MFEMSDDFLLENILLSARPVMFNGDQMKILLESN